MKRETAIRHAVTISARAHAVCGVLATPNASYEAYRIKRVWVFGSTVKGAANPHDLDILMDGYGAGRRFLYCRGRKFDKQFRHQVGFRIMPDSVTQARRYLSRGMKMVRVHRFDVDGDIAYPRVMIYPRWDWSDG